MIPGRRQCNGVARSKVRSHGGGKDDACVTRLTCCQIAEQVQLFAIGHSSSLHRDGRENGEAHIGQAG